MKNSSSLGWRRVRLRELTTKIGSGITPRGGSEVYKNKGVVFLRSQNIQEGYLNLNDVVFLSEEIDSSMASSRVKKNDVLYNITGASIGRSALYKIDEKANVNQHVCIVRLKNDNSQFINYFLLSHEGRKQLDGFQAGGNRQGLNYQQLGSFKLELPSLPEQNRIVAVLDTWDRAIEKLTQKIKKKKNIKKGLMQELLTGNTRMPGFTKKWEVKKLGNLCDIGTGKKNNQDKSKNGIYPFFVRSPFVERINSYSYEGEAILVPGEGNIGKIFHYINGKFDFHQRVYKISGFRSGISGKFIYFYLLENFSRATKSDSVKATVDSLRLPTFTNFKIITPILEEQEQIVGVLTTADKEIQTLQSKLKLMQDQKKYLLNNLITGYIRTPETYVRKS